MLLLSVAFFKNYFMNTISVKLFGTRPEPTVGPVFGWSKLFTKVFSRRQKSPLASKELKGRGTRLFELITITIGKERKRLDPFSATSTGILVF